MTDRDYGSALDEAVDRLNRSVFEVNLTLRDRFTPTIRVAAHSMHVFWFQISPWYKRWWHIVRGCEWA